MRKFLTISLAILILFSLISCGNTGIETDPIDTDPIDSEPLTSESEATESEATESDPKDTNAPEEKDPLDFTNVNETVYVYGTEILNVRKKASAESEKMGEMKEGEQVTRIGYNENWSKISFYGNEYYASSDYLTTHAPLEFSDKTEKVYITAEGTLNLRKKPSPNADIVEYLPYGTELERTGIATEADEFGTIWSRLLYNGQVCYVNSKHVDTVAPATDDDFKSVDNEKVYVINKKDNKPVEVLNLRALPSLSSNIVKSVAADTELVRIGISKEADEDGIVWSKVLYEGTVCYASSSYLTTVAPENSTETEATE